MIFINIKHVKVINVVVMFVASFLIHYLYELLPFTVISIIAPVNESIWEHMKIIYTVFVLSGIVEYIICKIKNIKINNILVEIVTKSILGVVVYLSIYIPIYLLFGEYMVISIVLMLLDYILMEYIGYKINMQDEMNINILPIILIILGYILFFLLTIYPRYNFLFFDPVNLGYGIIK